MPFYYIYEWGSDQPLKDSHGLSYTINKETKEIASGIHLPFDYVEVKDGYSYEKELATYKGGLNPND